MEYTFKKSTCERYDLRFREFGWAIFTIDENGGVFNCQSDFGDYSHCWPNHGRKTFKHFLIEINRSPDYLLGKISEENYFYFDKSLEDWKNGIISRRKELECTKEEAREAWNFINDIDSSMPYQLLQNELYGSSELKALCSEPWYVFETELDYPPHAKRFVNEIMPMFAEILKAEIEGA